MPSNKDQSGQVPSNGAGKNLDKGSKKLFRRNSMVEVACALQPNSKAEFRARHIFV